MRAERVWLGGSGVGDDALTDREICLASACVLFLFGLLNLPGTH